eukprot:2268135-Amphidinium_carterae.1
MGPYTDLSQVEAVVGRDFVLNRRFPLRQRTKLRPIDDYSESNVNAAYATPFKLDFTDVDTLAVAVGLIADLVTGARREVTLRDGSIRAVRVHRAWMSEEWLGQTLDLAHAYKQLGVKPSARWTSVGGIFSPYTKGAEYFIQSTLPFGAGAAVDGFNRASRSLWMIGVV